MKLEKLLFQIRVDGKLVQTIWSPERTSAMLDNVNATDSHHFAITAVPKTITMVPSQEKFLLTPAIYFYSPKMRQ